MFYKSSYNDIKLLVRSTYSQKCGHAAFWRFVRPKFKESGYTNSQSQPTTYFRNTLEFARMYEFELESYFHMYKVWQLIEGTNHFHKFTVATRG